jgi:hypothetical protein
MRSRRDVLGSVDNVLMSEYHDREWGVPVHDDPGHCECLVSDHLMDCFRYRDVRRLGMSRKWSQTRGGSQKHK